MKPVINFFSTIFVGALCVTVISCVKANSHEVHGEVVGYAEVSPGICEVNFIGEDNELYTFEEDCYDEHL